MIGALLWKKKNNNTADGTGSNHDSTDLYPGTIFIANWSGTNFLTNLVIYFSLYLLGWKLGTLSYVIYLLIGLVGVPVFSGFTAGPAKLLAQPVDI